MGLGFGGVAFDAVQHNQPSNVSATASGGGVALDIGVGGTVARGLVVGGAFLIDSAGRPESTNARGGYVYGSDAQPFSFGQASLVSLGLLADWYVKPNDGLHFLGALSVAGFAMDDSRSSHTEVTQTGTAQVPDVKKHGASGGSFTLGAGYEFWIGDQWSLGPLLRATYASTRTSDDEWSHRVWAIALLATATYH